MPFKILFAFLLLSSLHADPWGKDADLVTISASCSISSPSSLPLALIRFHQEVISPADGPRSHYIPSSSQYTYDAISRYGFFKGWILGCDRLMRENSAPWIYRTIVNPEGVLLKWDPVR